MTAAPNPDDADLRARLEKLAASWESISGGQPGAAWYRFAATALRANLNPSTDPHWHGARPAEEQVKVWDEGYKAGRHDAGMWVLHANSGGSNPLPVNSINPYREATP